MLEEKHSLKLKVVKESDEPSEKMFKHMMKIMKLEIKSTINVPIQINREDKDMSLVEMELWYLYAMEESYVRVHKCRLQRVNNGNQKDVVAASNNKDTDQPTKVNEQLEQQSKLYESDEEFQENNGQVTDDEELQGRGVMNM